MTSNTIVTVFRCSHPISPVSVNTDVTRYRYFRIHAKNRGSIAHTFRAGHTRSDPVRPTGVARGVPRGIATVDRNRDRLGCPGDGRLIAAVVGGVVAGAIGGSPLQVSGPAAGLTVVVAELVANFGWKVTCAITVCAGVLQILFGLSRIAGAALAIAPVVVHAMLAGIGITIALQQIHVLLGGNSSSSAVANITGLPDQLIDVNVAEASIGLLVIAALLAWPRLPATVRKIPGPLGAIVLATLVALIAGLDVKRITLDGNFFESIALPELPTGNWSAFILGVLTVALIASVESLLSAVAVDKMHDGPRSNFNRELLGQGSANMVSGVLGGLPVTGVIVRSSTNVATGARTRWSAILHGVWVFVFAVFLTALVEQIPTAALAGLLVVIGMQLVKLAHMKTALRTGDLWVYGVTVTAVVFLNLLEGVAIGLALAVILVLWRVIRPDTHTEEQPDGRHIVRVRGSLSFVSLPRMNSLLRRIPEGAPVTIELDTDFLDHAASEMLEDWIRARRAAGGEVIILERGRARIEHAWQAPPRRHTGGIVGLTPWRSRSSVADDEQVAEVPAPLRSIMAGVTEYHRDHAEVLRGHLSDVVDYQEPDAFFLTCADSRIMPNIITSSGQVTCSPCATSATWCRPVITRTARSRPPWTSRSPRSASVRWWCADIRPAARCGRCISRPIPLPPIRRSPGGCATGCPV